MENDSQTLDNIGQENLDTVDLESLGPLVVEKPKRKKQETNRAAQLETLKRGRKRLAEKRKQQRKTKNRKWKSTEPVNIEKTHDHYITKLNETYKKINDDLNSFASPINASKENSTPMGNARVPPNSTASSTVATLELQTWAKKKVIFAFGLKSFYYRRGVSTLFF